jgi:hypothetical protein
VSKDNNLGILTEIEDIVKQRDYPFQSLFVIKDSNRFTPAYQINFTLYPTSPLSISDLEGFDPELLIRNLVAGVECEICEKKMKIDKEFVNYRSISDSQ